MESPEWKTFSELFNTIHIAIRSGVGPLANQAFSRGLLTSTQLNTATFLFMPPDHQADQFLAAIRSRIETNPESLLVFRDILDSEPVYEPIVKKIDATLALHRPAEALKERKEVETSKPVAAGNLPIGYQVTL